MQHIGELTSCIQDAIVELVVPRNLCPMRKYRDRAHFLFYANGGALPIHLEIGRGRSYRSFVDKRVVGRAFEELVTEKGGQVRCILLIVPTEDKEPNAHVTCSRSGDFAVVALR